VELRVATYNIKAGSGGDNVLDADHTAAAIAETGADGSKGATGYARGRPSSPP
jgi:hypothetical protein